MGVRISPSLLGQSLVTTRNYDRKLAAMELLRGRRQSVCGVPPVLGHLTSLIRLGTPSA